MALQDPPLQDPLIVNEQISRAWQQFLIDIPPALNLNTTHRTSDGSDHTFIDQDVTNTSSPTFINITATTLDLLTAVGQDYKAGRISYDPVSLVPVGDTGVVGVRVRIGQEMYYLVSNQSGAQINNGKAVYTGGIDVTNNLLTINLADNSAFATSAQILGLATHNIPNNTIGLVTNFGQVRDFDTTGIGFGPSYLGTSGNLTNVKPLYPSQRILVGAVIKSDATSGIVQVQTNRLSRNSAGKSYSFTSQGIGAGVYWKAGFYEWSSTDANLTQASTTQTHGTASYAKAAHASIVAGGAGTVDTGQVGLRVTGTKDSSTGVQVASQTGIITTDITTLTLDTYYETSEKFSGQITFELYVVSGSPTTYSLDFNYGFSKYDDFQNRDFTVTGFEAVWQGNANSSLDVALMKHTSTGWTYAATGFAAGNGDVCRKTVDQAIETDVQNGLDGAYKRIELDTFFSGTTDEGVIIEVTTGANNTIQTMDLHIDAVSEELDF